MSVISIRLPDKLLDELVDCAHSMHVKRADYIRKAIVQLNHEVFKAQRDQKLARASMKVRKESMRINKEFSELDHDPEL